VLGLSMGTERRYRMIVCAGVEKEGKMGPELGNAIEFSQPERYLCWLRIFIFSAA